MGHRTHVWRMFAFLAIVLVVAVTLRWAFRPDGYDSSLGFRPDDLSAIAGQTVVHQGKGVCGECHDEILATHGKDTHFRVECEVCHGAGQAHVRLWRDGDETISEELAAMPKEYTLEGCLFCHRRMTSRPTDFPQVDPVGHYRFLGVTDPGTPCVECHSPHEPLFLLTGVEEARIHPIVRECEECHEARPTGNFREEPGHPVLFECRDCHPAVTNDFARRDHADLRCTACHLFHREGESAGRIYKNGNRRFCLLCHESKPFRDGAVMPLIVSAEHVPEMAEMLDEDPGALARDPRACLECHYDFIHDRELIERRGALSHE